MGRTRHRGQDGTDEVLAGRSSTCCFGQSLPDIASWMIGTVEGVVIEDQRGSNPRHLLQDGLGDRGDLRVAVRIVDRR